MSDAFGNALGDGLASSQAGAENRTALNRANQVADADYYGSGTENNSSTSRDWFEGAKLGNSAGGLRFNSSADQIAADAVWNQGGLVAAAASSALDSAQKQALVKSFSDTQHQAYTKVLAQNRTEAEAISIAQMVGIGQKVDAYAAALSPYNVANASALQRVAVINDMRMSADSYLRQSVQELLPPGVSRAGALQAAELSGGLPYSDSNSGFASALYRNANTGHYTLAFRGTDDFNLGSVGSVGSMAKNWQLTPDVRASLLQREGLRSTQYDQAVDLASTLAASEIGKKLSFTGHSLGGGLASVAAMSTRLNATTFNASGIHEGTGRLYSFPLRDAPKYVAAYHVIGEGLAASQDAIPSRMPQAIGHRPAYGAAACSTDG